MLITLKLLSFKNNLVILKENISLSQLQMRKKTYRYFIKLKYLNLYFGVFQNIYLCRKRSKF